MRGSDKKLPEDVAADAGHIPLSVVIRAERYNRDNVSKGMWACPLPYQLQA